MQEIRSIRPFIGARDYGQSRAFYLDLGFSESVISPTMSLFSLDGTAFYLQDYFVEDWISNTMMLLEVAHVEQFWQFLTGLNLGDKYPGIRLIPIRQNDWGDECMLIDPSGVLWHFAEFR